MLHFSKLMAEIFLNINSRISIDKTGIIVLCCHNIWTITWVPVGINLQIIIREYGNTLYVGLAHTAPPTNTNFRLTFLLTRFQEALYEDLPV